MKSAAGLPASKPIDTQAAGSTPPEKAASWPGVSRPSTPGRSQNARAFTHRHRADARVTPGHDGSEGPRVFHYNVRRLARFFLALGLFCASAPAAAQKPQRIVSLNLCADELVLRLADRDKVASVTWLARDARGSNVAERAKDVPVNRGLAEEVATLKPDLVIVGAFTTRTTTAMLQRLGIPVLEISVPQSLDEAYAQIRQVAERIGEPARGEAMVVDMKAAFARLPPAPAQRPTAIVLRPNGFTAGRGSIADEILGAAGLDNLATRLSTDRMGQLTLEEIVKAQPDLLVINASADGPPSLADDLLRHPALARFTADGRTVPLPTRLWTCAGPELAEAAGRLAAARTGVAR